MEHQRRNGPPNPNRRTHRDRPPKRKRRKKRIKRDDQVLRAPPAEATAGQVSHPSQQRSGLGAARHYWSVVHPHLTRTIGRGAELLAVMLGFGVRHRVVIFRASHRMMWWSALAILLIVGQALLGGLESGLLTHEAHVYFAVGLGLCATVLFFAAERRLRLASFFLGTSHGAMALMAWLVSQG